MLSHCQSKMKFSFLRHIWRASLSSQTSHKPPVVFWSNLNSLSPSFFRQVRKVYFSLLLRPSPLVGIISRLRIQFHTTVSQSRVHSAPIGSVMRNQSHLKGWQLCCQRLGSRFKATLSISFVFWNFILSVRQPVVLEWILRARSLSFIRTSSKMHVFGKVLEIELLSAGFFTMWRHFLIHFMISHIHSALLIQMPVVYVSTSLDRLLHPQGEFLIPSPMIFVFQTMKNSALCSFAFF